MENDKLEYKTDIPKKANQLKAEIVSFLNSQGGDILLGVDDDGNKIHGVEKQYKKWEEIISNWIFSAFYPSVVDLVKIKIDDYFTISIKKGTNKPYYYKDGEGFNSKGVYVRVGSTKRIASYEEIQRMMIASKTEQYEKLPSDNQELTFTYLEKKFREKNLKFDLKGSSLINSDGRYNNAALFLSDQNPIISKLALFKGKDLSYFLDKKEFKGSIVQQLDELLHFSYLYNKKKVVITGKPQRDEYDDIPPRALREAICNCFSHRDFSLMGNIKLEFYDDRVVIFSPGSLPNGLTLEDIKNGMTATRNNIIVSNLDKLEYIENYATGVRRIFEDYADFHKKPLYEITDNSVILTLYNKNYYSNDLKDVPKNVPKNDLNNILDIIENKGFDRSGEEKLDKDLKIVPKDVPNDIPNRLSASERQDTIVEYIKDFPEITIAKLSQNLNVSEKTIKRDIEKLKNEKIICREGSLNKGKWLVIKKGLLKI